MDVQQGVAPAQVRYALIGSVSRGDLQIGRRPIVVTGASQEMDIGTNCSRSSSVNPKQVGLRQPTRALADAVATPGA